MNMKIVLASILMIFAVSCSKKQPAKGMNHLNAGKDIPTPKSDITTTNPNEGLAPQTCYYGCKARK